MLAKKNAWHVFVWLWRKNHAWGHNIFWKKNPLCGKSILTCEIKLCQQLLVSKTLTSASVAYHYKFVEILPLICDWDNITICRCTVRNHILTTFLGILQPKLKRTYFHSGLLYLKHYVKIMYSIVNCLSKSSRFSYVGYYRKLISAYPQRTEFHGW